MFDDYEEYSEYCVLCHSPLFSFERSAPHSDICEFCEEELTPDDYSVHKGDDWDGSDDDFFGA